MSLALWNEPLSPVEREKLLSQVVDAIAQRRLQTPALFLLEMNRPLAFLASQAIVSLAPLIAPLIGLERIQLLERILADPDAVDTLIRRIEESEATTAVNVPPTEGAA